MKKKVVVNNSMQKGYVYYRTEPFGEWKDHPEFNPMYTPYEMLCMGVFEGQYFDINSKEFTAEWLVRVRLEAAHAPHQQLNYFGVQSRLPLSKWKEKGWIHKDDPRGWFEWYCRFYMGRRHVDDARQIARWRNFGPRHTGAILKHCPAHNKKKHPNIQKRRRQRQAILQWSHNPFV